MPPPWKLSYIGVNSNEDTVAVATSNDMRILGCNGLDKHCLQIPGISICDAGRLRVAFVERGSPNEVKLYDLKELDICGAVTLPDDVINLKITEDYLFICVINAVHVYNVGDMTIKQKIETAYNPAGLISVCRDGGHYSVLVPNQRQGFASLFPLHLSKVVPGALIDVGIKRIGALAVSPDGTLVAFTDKDGCELRLFDTLTLEMVGKRNGKSDGSDITSLSFQKSGSFLASSSANGTLAVYMTSEFSNDVDGDCGVLFLLCGIGSSVTEHYYSIFEHAKGGSPKVYFSTDDRYLCCACTNASLVTFSFSKGGECKPIAKLNLITQEGSGRYR